MTTIRYLKGDATCPQAAGPKIICHICDDRGGWGKGFVLAISRHWPQPEEQFRAWYNSKDGTFALGAVAFIPVKSDIIIRKHDRPAWNDGIEENWPADSL